MDRTEHTPCSICGYPLPTDWAGVCPECGGDEAARRAAATRRVWPRRWLIIHAILMAPAWCAFGVLVTGWVAAHVFIGIKNPHWVQHGEHPILDILGGAATLTLLSGVVSVVAVLVTVPCVLASALAPGVAVRARWRLAILAVVLAVPALLMIAMARPFGGSVWGLVDWIPD